MSATLAREQYQERSFHWVQPEQQLMTAWLERAAAEMNLLALSAMVIDAQFGSYTGINNAVTVVTAKPPHRQSLRGIRMMMLLVSCCWLLIGNGMELTHKPREL